MTLMSCKLGSLVKYSSNVHIWDVDMLRYRSQITKNKQSHARSIVQSHLKLQYNAERRDGPHGDCLRRANIVKGRA